VPRCRYLVIVDDPESSPAFAFSSGAFGAIHDLPDVSSRGKTVQDLRSARCATGAACSSFSPLAQRVFAAGGEGCHNPVLTASLCPAMRPRHYGEVCHALG
jgi:hypothetical protein